MELTNTAVELDDMEVSNPEQLDMSAIDHPLSDLGGLNIPAQNPVQQSGGDPTKPGSPAPKTIGDIRNLIKLNNAEGLGTNISPNAYNNAWRPDAQSNLHPRLGYDVISNQAIGISDRIIEDGSYLKIKNILLMDYIV